MADSILPLREQIYLQVRGGNMTEALALLEKTGNQNIQLIKVQFERAHEDFSLGLISFESFAVTLARTHFAILEWTPGEAPVAAVTDISKDQVRKLAEAGELGEALQMLLPAIEQDATLLLARLNSMEKYFEQGLVTEEEQSRLKFRVKMAILELAE